MLHSPTALSTSVEALGAGPGALASAAGALAAPAGAPAPLTGSAILTETRLDNWLAVALILAAGLYLYGVHRLRLRGDRWPLARTVLFLGPGLGSAAFVLLSGLAAYEDVLLSAHMVQHMVLTMVAPIFLALGAPVTLALRIMRGAPRQRLLAFLHSRYVRVMTFPLVAYALFIANPFVLYFSDLYRLTLSNTFAHEWLHVHFLATGCFFFWPLLGLDPLPGRWPYPGRALLMLLSTPFHTVLGLTVMQSRSLIGGDWYPSLGLDWLDPWADQRLAGGILWAGGEIVSVAMLAVLVVQWVSQSEREARRLDRDLDRRAKRRTRTGGPTPAPTAGAPAAAAASTGGDTPSERTGVAAVPAEAVWEKPWWEQQ